jgi:DNA (cytosine-5)-methyltransferase 1
MDGSCPQGTSNIKGRPQADPQDIVHIAGNMSVTEPLSVLEICAGAGGQSLGLELAGFGHQAAVDIEPDACATLRVNRPAWTVIEGDVRNVSGRDYRGVDLVAGGVPCPPFSIASKQLGETDERDLFPQALRLVREARPLAVMLENVRGFASAKFGDYRARLLAELDSLGYEPDWQLLLASGYGVPQLRPRFVLVAMKRRHARRFCWPEPAGTPPTVGATLSDLMASRGWPGASAWADRADGIGPTIVGGSRKHGGPDLGPTRARREWLRLGVDGLGIADEPPGPERPVDFVPKLTLRMVARLQGFPDEWRFVGRKTAAHRQIGNAFPPPVAEAVAWSIRTGLTGVRRSLERPRQLALLA